MCHTIYSSEKGSFGIFNNYLVGNKSFEFLSYPQSKLEKYDCMDLQKVISPYYLYEFKFNHTHIGLCCKEEPVKQQVIFDIPVGTTGSKVPIKRIDLKAGMHISPLFDSSGNMINYPDIRILSPSLINLFSIPVFFAVDSIVFYDGYDVSVDRFYVANPVFFRNWLTSIQSDMGWDETYLNSFINWYTNIYEKIEKSKCLNGKEE